MDDSQIRAMISYVVQYMNKKYPDNLGSMIHLIGHDVRYRKKVSEITEAIVDQHDKLFVSVSDGKKIEEITPMYAEECEALRINMQKLVDEYLSECSNPN